MFQKVEKALNNGESVRIRLVGQSMYPFLDSRTDIITISPVKRKNLHVGDVVLAKINNAYVLHRLIDITNLGWCQMQGDAIVGKKDVVRIEDVIGILIMIERKEAQNINCSKFWWRFTGRCWITLRFCRKGLLKICSRTIAR